MRHISKITVFILLAATLFFSSCSKGPVSGVYKGDIFYVSLQYTFSGTSFTAETFTGNGVLIGGGKGQFSLEEDVITFNYKRRYIYDNDTNSGAWHDDDKVLTAQYLADTDMVKLSTESGLEVELKKE